MGEKSLGITACALPVYARIDDGVGAINALECCMIQRSSLKLADDTPLSESHLPLLTPSPVPLIYHHSTKIPDSIV
jgi:hypothetical protein